MIEAVWPGVVVEEGNLATQISTLRKILGTDCIATIPGRGYRFVATPACDDAAPGPAAAAATRPAPAAPGATPGLQTQLPAVLPTLLGRTDDLAALGGLIDAHRLVTIVGPGGIGKTLLSQHLLAGRRTAYPHGVCWISVPQTVGAEAVPGLIAAGLGVNPGFGDPLEGLCTAVAPLTMLLALDNAEHIADAMAGIAEALPAAAPGLRLLVTSQVPLRLAAERVYRLGALAIPPEARPAAEMLAFGAVALFAERAQSADARFALTDAQVPAVIELCRRLDGHPLAIELAAARAPMLGVHKLAASMDDRLRLLTGGRNRTAPARQQTLRATLEWSHGLLDERERIVFRRLAVFAGSATLARIQEVVADAALDAWDVLDALAVLVDRSLVATVFVEAGGEPRYRLLDTPRLYALERLREPGEEDRWRARHAAAFATLAQEFWDAQFEGRARVDACEAAFALDLDNFRAAMAWGHAADDAHTVLRIAATMLWTVPRSAYREGLAVCDRCEPLLARATDAELRLRTGWSIAQRLADVQRVRCLSLVRALAAEATQLVPSPANRRLGFLLHCRLAIGSTRPSDQSEALRALEIAAALKDPTWPPLVLSFGADARHWVDADRGDHAVALAAVDEYVLLLRRAGASEGVALANRVDAELAAGNAAAAAATGAPVVAQLSAGRDEFAVSYARINLAGACLEIGDPAQARAALEAGWANAALFDDAAYYADYLALLAALDGRHRAAALVAGWADARNAELGDRQPNEQAAVDRAAGLARAALGAARFEALRVEGAHLTIAEIGALAFATTEAV